MRRLSHGGPWRAEGTDATSVSHAAALASSNGVASQICRQAGNQICKARRQRTVCVMDEPQGNLEKFQVGRV